MDAIAVIDFGGQYAHLIANRIRRHGVYAEIFVPETPLEKLRGYKGIILSGGPNSVYEKTSPTIDLKIFNLGVPILGVCYGHQLITHMLGGLVKPGTTKEYGLAELKVERSESIFKGLKKKSQVWMSHGDTVVGLPAGFALLGSTGDCPMAAIADLKRNIFSTQFHVEVAHTHEGGKILDNFLKICRVKREWKMATFLKEKLQEIRTMLRGRNVFLLVSGGVDSTVAYAFLSKALGTDRVYGLFVDTGFLRKNEREKISKSLKGIGVKNFHIIDARKDFIHALKGVTDPEEKRHIIGDMFLKVQASAVAKLKLDAKKWVLGQGTIYPDTIESAGTKHADKIKTHHNRVPEILEKLKRGEVIEPLAELYKDEVRALGAKLGLPDSLVWRHPFPGPGLAIRILCAKKATLPADHRAVEKKINEFLSTYGLESYILPIQSVGVQGDNRTYRNPLLVSGKMTDFKDFEILSTALTNRFMQINRVCLLLSPSRYEKVRLIPATLTPQRIALAQKLDDIVMNFVQKNKLDRVLWQFPTVLIPLAFNGSKKESVVLRPMCSDEAMTAQFYKMDWKLLKKLTKRLSPYVSAVLYDMTNKPPGTIEWE